MSMKTIQTLSVLLLACLIGACGTNSMMAPREFLSATAAGLEFSASISKDVIPQGDTATFSFVLRNNTSEAVVLRFNSGCQLLPFVRDSRRQVHPDGGYVCTGALTSLTVPAGQQVERSIVLFAGQRQLAIQTSIPLEAGDYIAFAEIADGQGRTNSVSFKVSD